MAITASVGVCMRASNRPTTCQLPSLPLPFSTVYFYKIFFFKSEFLKSVFFKSPTGIWQASHRIALYTVFSRRAYTYPFSECAAKTLPQLIVAHCNYCHKRLPCTIGHNCA